MPTIIILRQTSFSMKLKVEARPRHTITTRAAIYCAYIASFVKRINVWSPLSGPRFTAPDRVANLVPDSWIGMPRYVSVPTTLPDAVPSPTFVVRESTLDSFFSFNSFPQRLWISLQGFLFILWISYQWHISLSVICVMKLSRYVLF